MFNKTALAMSIFAILVAPISLLGFYERVILYSIPLLTALIWLIRYGISIRKLSLLHWVVLTYLFASFISVFHSLNPSYSFSSLAIYTSIILLAYYITNEKSIGIKSFQVYSIITQLLLVFVIFNTIFSIMYPSESWKHLLAGGMRFTGTYGHPVVFAKLLVLFIILATGRMFYLKGISMLFHALIIAVVCYQIFLTATRSAWIILIIVFMFMLLKMPHIKELSKNTRYYFPIIITSLLILPTVTIIVFGYSERASDIFTRGGEDIWRLTGRVDMWHLGWKALNDKILIGDGFAMAGRLVGEELSRSPTIIDNPVIGIGGMTHVHNALLQATLQTNIIGTIAFIFFVFLTLKNFILTFRNHKLCSSIFLSFVLPTIILATLLDMWVSVHPAIGRGIPLFLFFGALFTLDNIRVSRKF